MTLSSVEHPARRQRLTATLQQRELPEKAPGSQRSFVEQNNLLFPQRVQGMSAHFYIFASASREKNPESYDEAE